MKAVLIVFAIYLAESKCYQFPNVTPHYYVPIVNIRGINASIVFLKHDNTDDVLISSLVVGLYSDQSVILSRGEGFAKANKGLLNKDPNIILVSNERITVDELDSVPFKVILKSYWSPLYLIITIRNGSLTCENGTFNKVFLKEIEISMNYIWHIHRIVRMVVSFPYTCPYHFIVYGEKKESIKGLYDRSIKIITAKNKKELEKAIMVNSKLKQLTAGYPLRANIFERFPTSIKLCAKIDIYMKVNLNYTNGFCGLDGLVMHDYVNHYQFNLSVPQDESCDIYGFVEPDTQRMTGSLGCIIDNKMDISFDSRFMVQYTTKHFFYLHYITTDSLAVVLKRPDEIPLWHYALSSFGPRAGITLHILILLLGVITWASAWITREIEQQEPQPLQSYIFNAVTCTLFGFPIQRSNRFRILRGTSLICSIILLSFYQGNVNYYFTTRTRYKEIKTLNQLYNSQNTLYTSPSIQNILVNTRNEQDKDQLAYFNRTQLKDDTLGIGFILNHERAATVARGEDVRIQVLYNTDEAGSPLAYVVDEPFHVYYLSYICRTGFLFTEETNIFMMRLLEAGLPIKYYVWTRRTLKFGVSYPKTGAEPRPTEKLEMRDLRIAFGILGTGSLLSTFSFLVELYKGYSKKKYAVTPSSSSEMRN